VILKFTNQEIAGFTTRDSKDSTSKLRLRLGAQIALTECMDVKNREVKFFACRR
jgi:hypothetical protein